MKLNKLGLFVASLFLASCSNSPRVAEGDFEYLATKATQDITVPDGLSKPQADDSFSVPNLDSSGPTGSKVSILPPRLLIASAEGSRVDQSNPYHTIWFEQTEEISKLQPHIWKSLTDYFDSIDVKLLKEDEATGYIETDWVDHDILTGWWLWETSRTTERRRYSFQLNMKSHGRSGSVSVKLLEREAVGFNSDSNIIVEDNPGIATNMLNTVVGHYDYRLRLAAEKRRAEYAKAVSASVMTLSNEDTVLAVQAGFGHTWLRFIDALNELGMVITDINKLEGRVYGRINSDDIDLWDWLFGDEIISDLDLPAGDYVMELSRQSKNETHILFNTNNLEPLSKKQVDGIANDFIDIMSEDLDRK